MSDKYGRTFGAERDMLASYRILNSRYLRVEMTTAGDHSSFSSAWQRLWALLSWAKSFHGCGNAMKIYENYVLICNISGRTAKATPLIALLPKAPGLWNFHWMYDHTSVARLPFRAWTEIRLRFTVFSTVCIVCVLFAILYFVVVFMQYRCFFSWAWH